MGWATVLFASLSRLGSTSRPPVTSDAWRRLRRPAWARRNLTRSEWRQVVGDSSQFPARRVNAMPLAHRLAGRRWLTAKVPLPATVTVGLSMGCMALLIVAGHEERDHGYCDLSRYELAKRCFLSVGGLDKCRRQLVALGVLDCEGRAVSGRPHKTNVMTSNPDTERGRAFRAWIDAKPSRSILAQARAALDHKALPELVVWADWAKPGEALIPKVRPSGDFQSQPFLGTSTVPKEVVPREIWNVVARRKGLQGRALRARGFSMGGYSMNVASLKPVKRDKRKASLPPIVYKNYTEAEVKARQRLAKEENAVALATMGPMFLGFVKGACDFRGGISKTAKRQRRECCLAAMAMLDAMPWLSWAVLTEREYARFVKQRGNVLRFQQLAREAAQ